MRDQALSSRCHRALSHYAISTVRLPQGLEALADAFSRPHFSFIGIHASRQYMLYPPWPRLFGSRKKRKYLYQFTLKPLFGKNRNGILRPDHEYDYSGRCCCQRWQPLLVLGHSPKSWDSTSLVFKQLPLCSYYRITSHPSLPFQPFLRSWKRVKSCI